MGTKYQGLILCHGHKHKPIPKEVLTDDTVWTYVDKWRGCQPDIVGDLLDYNFLKQLGLAKYDKVVLWHAPLNGNEPVRRSDALTFVSLDGNPPKLINSALTLIKPGGLFYIDNYIARLLFKTSTDKSLDELREMRSEMATLIKTNHKSNYSKILNQFGIWQLLQTDLVNMQFHDIVIVNDVPILVLKK